MTPPTNKGKGKLAYMFISAGGLMLAVVAAILLRSAVSAQPADLSSAEGQYSFIVGTRIDTCNLCHVPNGIPNLNAYGQAYLNNGRSSSALTAIENIDSDGDGFTNIQELRAFTFPGDANDKPVSPTAAPTTAPTVAPTVVPPGPTATVGVPTTTPVPTMMPTPVGSVTPAPPAQCSDDDERNEHSRKHHGKSEDQISEQESENEQKLCEDQEDKGSEINEAQENEAEEMNEQQELNLGEHENQGENEDMIEPGSNNNQGENSQEGFLGIDLSFFRFIELWLSQWSASLHTFG